MDNTAQNDNMDRSWIFPVNLSGLQAPTGKSAIFLPEGYYIGRIKDMYINKEKNPGRVIIKLEVTEGEFAGVIRTDGLNTPTTGEDKVRYYWRGLAEACGYTSAQLDAGQVQLGPSVFVGKPVTFRYTPKEEGKPDREFEDILYLAQAEWVQQRQLFVAAAGQRAAASPVTAAVPAQAPTVIIGGTNLGLGSPPPAAAPTNVVGRDDLMSRLGVQLGKPAPAAPGNSGPGGLLGVAG